MRLPIIPLIHRSIGHQFSSGFLNSFHSKSTKIASNIVNHHHHQIFGDADHKAIIIRTSKLLPSSCINLSSALGVSTSLLQLISFPPSSKRCCYSCQFGASSALLSTDNINKLVSPATSRQLCSLKFVVTDSSPKHHNQHDDDELLHSTTLDCKQTTKASHYLNRFFPTKFHNSSIIENKTISSSLSAPIIVSSLNKYILFCRYRCPDQSSITGSSQSSVSSFFSKRTARVAALRPRFRRFHTTSAAPKSSTSLTTNNIAPSSSNPTENNTTTTKTMAPIEPTQNEQHEYDYDLIVIGGGSGGLAASKEAAALGKKVCMLDFVTPTPKGTTWGVGGTCVNVGCIPKKLMHHASLIGSEIEDAHFFGWQSKDGKPLSENMKHDWSTLVGYVQNNIKGSNFSYRALLATQQVKYINAYGSFVDPHKVKIVYKNKKEEFLTSKHFIIATGERPVYPEDCEGAVEYSITSDDIFSLPYSPGKTLVVGASYVALECAGFLRGLGYDVSVMVRSIVLRGFDRQCSEHVRNYMENIEHVKFIDKCVMKKIEQIKAQENDEPPLLRATYRSLETNEEFSDEFNTILFAVGRRPCTDKIGLENVGVKLDKKGYIPTVNEQTNVPHVYAIGDIIQGKPQLTPVAIEAGVLLARRLFANHGVNCDYINVPTTVFTPLEYGCCGLTEEEAIEKLGADNIEVYHQYFTPTEWKLNYYDRPRKPMNVCYAKVITTRAKDHDPRSELLLGFHFVGPNAGEVIQFAALPLKMKATKADLDALIGIHPTCAEIFTMLPISKRSGKEATQQGCCG